MSRPYQAPSPPSNPPAPAAAESAPAAAETPVAAEPISPESLEPYFRALQPLLKSVQWKSDLCRQVDELFEPLAAGNLPWDAELPAALQRLRAFSGEIEAVDQFRDWLQGRVARFPLEKVKEVTWSRQKCLDAAVAILDGPAAPDALKRAMSVLPGLVSWKPEWQQALKKSPRGSTIRGLAMLRGDIPLRILELGGALQLPADANLARIFVSRLFEEWEAWVERTVAAQMRSNDDLAEDEFWLAALRSSSDATAPAWLKLLRQEHLTSFLIGAADVLAVFRNSPLFKLFPSPARQPPERPSELEWFRLLGALRDLATEQSVALANLGVLRRYVRELPLTARDLRSLVRLTNRAFATGRYATALCLDHDLRYVEAAPPRNFDPLCRPGYFYTKGDRTDVILHVAKRLAGYGYEPCLVRTVVIDAFSLGAWVDSEWQEVVARLGDRLAYILLDEALPADSFGYGEPGVRDLCEEVLPSAMACSLEVVSRALQYSDGRPNEPGVDQINTCLLRWAARAGRNADRLPGLAYAARLSAGICRELPSLSASEAQQAQRLLDPAAPEALRTPPDSFVIHNLGHLRAWLCVAAKLGWPLPAELSYGVLSEALTEHSRYDSAWRGWLSPHGVEKTPTWRLFFDPHEIKDYLEIERRALEALPHDVFVYWLASGWSLWPEVSNAPAVVESRFAPETLRNVHLREQHLGALVQIAERYELIHMARNLESYMLGRDDVAPTARRAEFMAVIQGRSGKGLLSFLNKSKDPIVKLLMRLHAIAFKEEPDTPKTMKWIIQQYTAPPPRIGTPPDPQDIMGSSSQAVWPVEPPRISTHQSSPLGLFAGPPQDISEPEPPPVVYAWPSAAPEDGSRPFDSPSTSAADPPMPPLPPPDPPPPPTSDPPTQNENRS